MSTAVSPAIEPDTKEHSEKRNEIHRRFLRALIADPARFADIPKDVVLCLLPDDDPSFVERELIVGADAARLGKNVYFRHVRVAELPEPPPRAASRVAGQRRTFFNPDGSIHAEVVGLDGEWHPVEPKPLEPFD